MELPALDILQEWREGRVPHVQPSLPQAKRVWGRVPAGPDRLEKLLGMWIDKLPEDRKDALRLFLPLEVQVKVAFEFWKSLSSRLWTSSLTYYILYTIYLYF